MLGTVLSIIFSGFVIGGLARWAVPGPDPMPFWLTVMIGLGGSAIGGGVVAAFIGATRNVSSSDYFSLIMGSIVGSMLLVIAYRRVVQKRPITGPRAHELPTRGIGIGRMRRRDADRERRETLKRLDELHEAGILTDEEYQAKRARVLKAP